MAQDALIKLRCSQELKRRLTALAVSREQKLSDYIRQRLVDVLLVEEEPAAYGGKLNETTKRPLNLSAVGGEEQVIAEAALRKAAEKVRSPRAPKQSAPEKVVRSKRGSH